MKKLSVVLATRNEEANIARCLNAVKHIADEIIIFDERSTDKTVEIAKKLGAKVFSVDHQANFHITKQKAIEKAHGDWILQMDADEVVTSDLSIEIQSVLENRHSEFISESIPKHVRDDKIRLFSRHSEILKSQGRFGKDQGEVVAFLIPRLNFFLGMPLRHAGVYPDPAIRLIKKGKARLPGKSVHEIMEVDGQVAWLFNDMEHHDSPTLERYLWRLNRYTDLQSEDFRKNKVPLNILNLIYFSSLKPFINFLKLYIRHKGYKDKMRGFVWSTFSSLHFPIAYFKYWAKYKK